MTRDDTAPGPGLPLPAAAEPLLAEFVPVEIESPEDDEGPVVRPAQR